MLIFDKVRKELHADHLIPQLGISLLFVCNGIINKNGVETGDLA